MEYVYICLFSSGHIKVGQSMSPHARINAHVQRVSCVGVHLVKKSIFAVSGNADKAEADLIAFCRDAADKQSGREWFSGLSFSDVCTEAQRICDGGITSTDSDDAALIQSYGGAKAFAEIVGATHQRAANWIRRGIPAAIRLKHRELFETTKQAA